MATEEGHVIKTDKGIAWIRVSRSAACESCQSRNACHSLGGGEKDLTVAAVNPVGAREGDRVVIEFSTASLMKGTFLIYLFPILCLLAGAGLGVRLSPLLGWDESALSALSGLGAFVLAIILVVVLGNRLGKKDAYKPKIIRVFKPLPPA
ncbi:MAG: SoxR reducing system RseC family protein [Thermodesulfobacteriota bacterium]